jgi:hypothetical protein
VLGRSGLHGNGLYLAGEPTSWDLCCSAGGGLWPDPESTVAGRGAHLWGRPTAPALGRTTRSQHRLCIAAANASARGTTLISRKHNFG